MHTKFFYLTLLLISSLFGCGNDKINTSMTLEVNGDYLILPVQESAKEVIVSYSFNNQESHKTWVKLAVDSVDFWVKMKVSHLKGHRVEFQLKGDDVSDYAISKMYIADTLVQSLHEKYRLKIHFSPNLGWMNDPNGMVYLDGKYHLFYQHNPFGNKWGNMHWGHAVTNDLIYWTDLEDAIAVDTMGSIFSGSSVIDVQNSAGFGEGAMIAIYTIDGKSQAQGLAYSLDKGKTFTKYQGNPILSNPGIIDFRDPKVFWHDETSSWIMSLATGQSISFYKSKNLKEWFKLSSFGESLGAHGGVWECPDLFPLTLNGDTKWILLVSINPGGINGGSATQYFIGDFDGERFTANPMIYPQWVDYGRDNYAGVTWSNLPKIQNRTVFLGWMSNWEYANDVPTKLFRNSMTIPRELRLHKSQNKYLLRSYPVREVLNLAQPVLTESNLKIKNKVTLPIPVYEGAFLVNFEISPMKSSIFGFKLQNRNKEDVDFKFDMQTQSIFVDRENSGIIDFSRKFQQGAGAPIELMSNYDITILVDRSSVEFFLNEGERVISSLVFPKENYSELEFYTNKEIEINNISISQIP